MINHWILSHDPGKYITPVLPANPITVILMSLKHNRNKIIFYQINGYKNKWNVTAV